MRLSSRRFAVAVAVTALLLAAPAAAEAGKGRTSTQCVPGAPGVGDEYFPTYGNGGYDARHYDLDVEYDPATDRLEGEASLRARATESLCSFNLDFVGLEVRRVEVDGRRADWTRSGQELVVTPKRPLKDGRRFEVDLATIDISNWDVHRWRTDTGLPVYDAVDAAITGGLRAEIDAGLARQGEVLDLLVDAFGPYPFSTIGAIVPNQDDLFFALETQTRPVYSKLFWLDRQGNPANADFVIVHELAHMWLGDDVALARWQDIWLNEGFATYAEWLWEEHEGRGTPQEIFQATYDAIPADDPFWATVIGDPGVELLFDNAVYVRGAMTLQALRNEVGDVDFFEIIRTWASSKSGGNATADEFIALAEQVSGQQLDELFRTWLFTPSKPPPLSTAASQARVAEASIQQASERAATWLNDVQRRLAHGRY